LLGPPASRRPFGSRRIRGQDRYFPERFQSKRQRRGNTYPVPGFARRLTKATNSCISIGQFRAGEIRASQKAIFHAGFSDQPRCSWLQTSMPVCETRAKPLADMRDSGSRGITIRKTPCSCP
jgi:hypothetical protein